MTEMNLHPDTQNPFSQVLLHIFLIEDETQKKKIHKREPWMDIS